MSLVWQEKLKTNLAELGQPTIVRAVDTARKAALLAQRLWVLLEPAKAQETRPVDWGTSPPANCNAMSCLAETRP